MSEAIALTPPVAAPAPSAASVQPTVRRSGPGLAWLRGLAAWLGHLAAWLLMKYLEMHNFGAVPWVASKIP